MAKKKKKTLQELSLEELEKKRKWKKFLAYLSIGGFIALLSILGIKSITGTTIKTDYYTATAMCSVLGVIPYAWKEFKKVEKELAVRKITSTHHG